jgi:hypothetical protein
MSESVPVPNKKVSGVQYVVYLFGHMICTLLHTEHLIDSGGFSIYHHPIFETV